jgi:hypothetical protein
MRLAFEDRTRRNMAGSGSVGGWIAGIIAAIIGGVAVALVVPRVIGKPEVGGTLESVGVQSTNPCCAFAVRAKVVGYKGKECPLRVEVFDLDIKRHGRESTVVYWIPDADTDESTQTIKVRLVPTGHRYLIRFVMYDPNNHEMDTKDSPAFLPVS